MITICGTRSRIGEAIDPFILCCHQHIQETINVCFVSGNWIINRSWHRTQCRLMQYILHTCNRLSTRFQIANITFDKAKAFPLLTLNQTLHFIQIVLMSGSEVIQPDNGLIQFKESFQ
eukprot:gnl/TRDRNA2_/TRDRNA2_171684_c2_seq2.p2 gnl/TRDRNA2_/TRDRNA2_171684_c2~~gnl/TRDRNA2_/TRDRNA2_171684_c2_seq2.p2  ORF type:complete len:118 (+),score=9.61 gnl/TRDRNA2_/TRDRNA2_171684_c2_seq2:391-744(+)